MLSLLRSSVFSVLAFTASSGAGKSTFHARAEDRPEEKQSQQCAEIIRYLSAKLDTAEDLVGVLARDILSENKEDPDVLNAYHTEVKDIAKELNTVRSIRGCDLKDAEFAEFRLYKLQVLKREQNVYHLEERLWKFDLVRSSLMGKINKAESALGRPKKDKCEEEEVAKPEYSASDFVGECVIDLKVMEKNFQVLERKVNKISSSCREKNEQNKLLQNEFSKLEKELSYLKFSKDYYERVSKENTSKNFLSSNSKKVHFKEAEINEFEYPEGEIDFKLTALKDLYPERSNGYESDSSVSTRAGNSEGDSDYSDNDQDFIGSNPEVVTVDTPAPTPECKKPGCGKPTWNGRAGEWCGSKCKREEAAALAATP